MTLQLILWRICLLILWRICLYIYIYINVYICAVQTIQMLLECCSCTETLTKPRTLSCFHSFCHHCLEKFVATRREDAMKAGNKVPEIFECPICRTEFHIKENESVEKIPSNYFINNMLELLILQQQAQSIKCQTCKAKDPATSKCVSCDKGIIGIPIRFLLLPAL